jgi:hypothetical protein
MEAFQSRAEVYGRYVFTASAWVNFAACARLLPCYCLRRRKTGMNTAEARYALFERAKTLVVQQLRTRRPPATEPEIVRECSALRAAIRKVESELAVNEIAVAKAPNSKVTRSRAKGLLGFATGFVLVLGTEALLFGGMELVSGHQLQPIDLGWVVMPVVAGICGWKLLRGINAGTTIGARRAFRGLGTWQGDRRRGGGETIVGRQAQVRH